MLEEEGCCKDDNFWALHMWPLVTVQCEKLINCERMQSGICGGELGRTCKNMTITVKG